MSGRRRQSRDGGARHQRYGIGMVRTSLPLRFRAEDRDVQGETLFAEVGGDVLVLTSCSPELGLELRSAYVAGPDIDEIQVAEASAVRTERTHLDHRLIEDAPGALIQEKRRLLYDHLNRLQDLALEAGCALSFDQVDRAAGVLDPLAPRSAAAH